MADVVRSLHIHQWIILAFVTGSVAFTPASAIAEDIALPTPATNNTELIVEPILPKDLLKHIKSLSIPIDAISIVVKNVNASTPRASLHADVKRNPASVMKMVTTFSALSELGPGFQWDMDVRRTGTIENGVLNGDLILVGKGNPFFIKPDLWNLLNQLETRGVRSVNGDLIIDSTYFDLPDYDPGEFDGRHYRAYNAGPSATLFNFNSMDFYLLPAKGKQLVDVRSSPVLKNVDVVSDVRQLKGNCRGSKISLRMKVTEKDDKRQVRFSGTYPEKCGRYHLTRSVVPSDELLYGSFMSMMEERGGSFDGNLMIGESPSASRKLFTLSSKTLSEVIRSTNKFSNNVMSRQLFLSVGAEKMGPPASLEKARKAVDQILREHGLSFTDFHMDNGSGLCRDCTVTAREISALLSAAWSSQYMPEFLASLAVPGVDGSLKKRFPKGDYKGRVHMKTGTIDHVSAAAGVAHTKSNQRYQFVLLINHKNIHKGKGQAFQRKFMSWLVNLNESE